MTLADSTETAAALRKGLKSKGVWGIFAVYVETIFTWEAKGELPCARNFFVFKEDFFTKFCP